MLQLLTYQQTVGVLFIVLSAMGNDVVYFMVILLCLEPQPQTQHRQPPAPYPQPNPYSYSNPYPHLHPRYQVIFLVLTVGFGVSFAVLLPNAMSEPWYRVMGNNPLWGSFWGVFGSFDVSGPLALEKAIAEGGDVLVEQLEPTTTLTPILLWIYQFVAAIILINLLIAQMADTYGRVTADGLVRWQFERAALISEYKDTKPPLPPPANLLCFTYSLLQWLLAKFCPGFVGDEEVTPGFQKVPDTMQLRILERREESALKECLRQRARRKKASPETKAEELRLNLAKLEEQSRARFEKLDEQGRARFEASVEQSSARFGALDRKMGAYQAALEHVRSAVLQAPRPAEQAPPSPRERRSSFLGGLFEGD